MEHVGDSDYEEQSAHVRDDRTLHVIFWFLLPSWPRLLPPQPLIVYPSSTELLAPATSYLAKRIFMQKVKKPIQVSVYTKCAKSSLPM